MSLTTILLLLLLGLLAGLLSGSVGVGGGVIMVPLAIWFLGYNQHDAQGLSLAVLAVPVTFLAAYNYHKAGEGLDWRYALVIAAAFVIGGYFGSKIAVKIDQQTLKKIFGVVLIIVAIKMIFFSQAKPAE
ncbi:permease [Nonlabens sp. MIC269]|nr:MULTISPECIES: sulfite exporter TauE/SafE family protein [Nonlabens]ALM22229.1 permease [Nonlabens sp. MIC269]ARN72573.1 anion permease [Nonlabens tegetincola]MEE2802628.1 sulfite exporter TauE/SafE family protein [Bacteroidota bacterium]PQJ17298.1 permease [Nonlabens tegetincola]